MRLMFVMCSFFVLSYCSQPEKPIQKKELKLNTKKIETNLPNKPALYSLDEILGKINPAKHPDFVKVNYKYCDKPMYLRKATYSAFIKMHDAAKKNGIHLVIRSGTRNFDRQKQIWEAKWTGARLVHGKNLARTISDPVKRALKILEYSSMPGTSRHHWGTDIDINAFENSYFEKGKGKKEYDWLIEHAAQFGFCQPYTKKDSNRPEGYQEEKWHWSYMPISEIFTKQAEKELTNEKIVGFKGSSTAKEIDVVKKYVLGINTQCK